MSATNRRRNEGACAQCALRKRKCDLQKPSCSQCRKRNSICEPKTFRHYTIPRAPRSRPRTNRPCPKPLVPLPRLSQSQSPSRFESQEDTLECNPSPIWIPSPTDAVENWDIAEWSSRTETQQTTISLSLGSNNGIAHPFPANDDDCSSLSPSMTASLSLLPSDFRNHPQHSFLWSYFVVRGTKIFLCWDVGEFGLDDLANDPYATTLTTIAAHSHVLRLAALALSAFLYSRDYPGSLNGNEVAAFQQRSLSALGHAKLKSEKNPIEFILASLIMQLLDMGGDTDSWKLTRKVMALLPNQSDTPYLDVAMHLLRWMYICKQFSFSNKPGLADEVAWRDLEFRDEELETSLCQQFRTWVIHPLYTVSHRWINPLLRLSTLVRLRRDASGPVAMELPADFDRQVDDLEEEILAAREQDLLVFLQASEDLADLLSLNEAIHSAIVLVFYTRLRDLAWTSVFARRQVSNVCQHTEAIGKYSRTLNNVVFPVFLAGCEAVDQHTRDRVMALLNTLHPAGFWYRQEPRLIANLQHIWAIRDEMPGALWPEWSQEVLLDNDACIPV